MVVLVLLGALLLGRGIWGLTGPSWVVVRSGDTMSVECDYDEGFEDYIKNWCKGEHFKSCSVQIRTEANKEWTESGRFTIRDRIGSRRITVTMSNMRPGDADIYYCGIERNLEDNRHMVTVRVLPGLCHKSPPWTDIVHFPENFTEIEVGHVVEVTCQEAYREKNITLRCTEGSGGFVLTGQSDRDHCVGLCRKSPPWTDIVHFPENFSQIEVGDVVEVTCQEAYREKNITLRCTEGSGGFVLTGQHDDDHCVGVCRKAPPWTDIVDFPENFTEISVNGSVIVSCQQRYKEMKLTLRCLEEAGGFILTPEDGQESCVAMNGQLMFLLTSTFGFVVPLVLKLGVLMVILGVKTSSLIKKRLRNDRSEPNQNRSLEERDVGIQRREQNTYIPPPPTAPPPSHRKKEQYEMSPWREEEEEEDYVNLEDEDYRNPVRNKKPKPRR